MADTFTLKDSKGKTYTAVKIPGRRIETTTLASTAKEHVEGLPSYQLQDGRALNYNDDDGTFEIVETGEILTRA